MKYPKIETLFHRDKDTFKVDMDRLKKAEFALIHKWHVTEKIDGMNIRVRWNCQDSMLDFAGRTDKAQLPEPLVDYLNETFTVSKMEKQFPNPVPVTLFGEGYGGKIQLGKNYRPTESFRLFDIAVHGESRTWWLNWPDIIEIADNLGVKTVPYIGTFPMNPIINWVTSHMVSTVPAEEGGANQNYPSEGVVARTDPGLLCRDGSRVMWKLKVRDF